MNKDKIIIGRHCSAKSPFFLFGAAKEAISYETNAFAFRFVGPI